MTDQLTRTAVYHCSASEAHDVNEWDMDHEVTIPRFDTESKEDTNKRFYEAAKALNRQISGCPKAKFVSFKPEVVNLLVKGLAPLLTDAADKAFLKLDMGARLAIHTIKKRVQAALPKDRDVELKKALTELDADMFRYLLEKLCAGPLIGNEACKI